METCTQLSIPKSVSCYYFYRESILFFWDIDNIFKLHVFFSLLLALKLICALGTFPFSKFNVDYIFIFNCWSSIIISMFVENEGRRIIPSKIPSLKKRSH